MKTVHNALSRKLGRLMLLVTAGLCSTPLLAQTCSTGGPVTLNSQAQVDSFQADYGPCDLMSNDLTLSGVDITDLSLLDLTTFVPLTLDSADLVIDGNPVLVTLDG